MRDDDGSLRLRMWCTGNRDSVTWQLVTATLKSGSLRSLEARNVRRERAVKTHHGIDHVSLCFRPPFLIEQTPTADGEMNSTRHCLQI